MDQNLMFDQQPVWGSWQVASGRAAQPTPRTSGGHFFDDVGSQVTGIGRRISELTAAMEDISDRLHGVEDRMMELAQTYRGQLFHLDIIEMPDAPSVALID